ncbi:MAG: hypothetical protein K6U14_10675 [Firmicutes bacterium]|nr:hypothetical protein [Alicyclobacillaceae bacterium]MCL6498075.1 hypothetical protein [Bacillota bacterium]
MTLVLVALALEAVGLVARLGRRGAQFRVAVTGMGPERGAEGARRALARWRPTWVIGLGFCGGLHPPAAVGSWAYPAAVVTEEGTVLALTPLPGHPAQGRMVSVARPVVSPAGKAALYAATGALWVDQEGFAWARACQAVGVPFTLVRWVLDGPEDPLPVLACPKSWRAVPHLAVLVAQGVRALAEKGEEMACGLS